MSTLSRYFNKDSHITFGQFVPFTAMSRLYSKIFGGSNEQLILVETRRPGEFDWVSAKSAFESGNKDKDMDDHEGSIEVEGKLSHPLTIFRHSKLIKSMWSHAF